MAVCCEACKLQPPGVGESLEDPPQLRHRLLDTEKVFSVSTAVDMLNKGTLHCPEDACVVYSSSGRAFFLLYRTHSEPHAATGCHHVVDPRTPLPPSNIPWWPRTAHMEEGFSTPRSRRVAPDEAATTTAMDNHTSKSHQCDASKAAPPGVGEPQEAPTLSNACNTEEVTENAQCDELQVGAHSFQLQHVVGRGAFGVVWKAVEHSPSNSPITVAVKAMAVRNTTSLKAAEFEADLLRLLAERLPVTSHEQVPRYIAHATEWGDGGGTVHVAMSFLPGTVLDQWLYGITDEEHKFVDVEQLIGGQLQGGRQRSMRLSGAIEFTRDLLCQLAGVFAALEPIAFHRDVSSHNVLVELEPPSGGGSPRIVEASRRHPKFALIDFGLAVPSQTWQMEWNSANLAGDPRYWAPAAWMAFAFGFHYLETHPNQGFHRQYVTRVDHYSLGILGLEVLFALWDTDEQLEGSSLHSEGGLFTRSMLEARKMWHTFWAEIVLLFQMFHMKGVHQTRQHLTRSKEGVMRVAQHLWRLRQALLSAAVAAEAAMGAASVAGIRSAAILRILVDLVDEHGIQQWAELPAMLGNTVEAPVAREDCRQGSQVVGTARPIRRFSVSKFVEPQPSFRGGQTKRCEAPQQQMVPSGTVPGQQLALGLPRTTLALAPGRHMLSPKSVSRRLAGARSVSPELFSPAHKSHAKLSQ